MLCSCGRVRLPSIILEPTPQAALEAVVEPCGTAIKETPAQVTWGEALRRDPISPIAA